MSEDSEDLRLLDALIQLVEGPGNVDVRVTCSMSGLLVTGHLVSRQTYVEGVLRDVGQSLGGDAAKAVRDTWSSAGDQARGGPGPDEWFHLRQARIFLVSTFVPGPPVERIAWWCGRRSSIDSFFLGSLQEDDDEWTG